MADGAALGPLPAPLLPPRRTRDDRLRRDPPPRRRGPIGPGSLRASGDGRSRDAPRVPQLAVGSESGGLSPMRREAPGGACESLVPVALVYSNTIKEEIE